MAISPRRKNRRICGFCASYSPLQFSLALLCDTSKNYKETIFAQGNGIPWRKNRPAPDVHAVGCDESAKELPPSRALLRGFDSMRDAGTRPAFAFGKGTDRLELYKERTAREKRSGKGVKLVCLGGVNAARLSGRLRRDTAVMRAYINMPVCRAVVCPVKAAMIQKGERGCSSSRFLRRINARKAECCLAAGKQYVCVL